jgi:hypothetical protein
MHTCFYFLSCHVMSCPAGKPSVYHGIQPGEHTGVIPFWRILLLPLLLLFLMSYFFEAPHQTFHTVSE